MAKKIKMLMHCLTLSRNGEVLCNFFLLACLIRSTIIGAATSTPVDDTTIEGELIFAHVVEFTKTYFNHFSKF